MKGKIFLATIIFGSVLGFVVLPLLNITSYNKKEKLIEKETYKYDAKGRLIAERHYDKEDSYITKITYLYDKKGNLTEIKYHSRGSNIFKEDFNHPYDAKWILKYDNNNRLIDSSKYDFFRTFHGDSLGCCYRHTYLYNKKTGIVIEEDISSYGDGKIDSKDIYKYDSKTGNKTEEYNYYIGYNIQEKTYENELTLHKGHVYKYNQQNKITEEYVYGDKDGYDEDSILVTKYGLDWKITCNYDSIGSIIDSMVCDSDGNVQSKWTFENKYDEKNQYLSVDIYRNKKYYFTKYYFIEPDGKRKIFYEEYNKEEIDFGSYSTRYAYDSCGNIQDITKIISDFSDLTGFISMSRYYEKPGKLSSKSFKYNFSDGITTFYEYDNRKNITDKHIMYTDHEENILYSTLLHYKYEYEYDAQGRIIKKLTYKVIDR